MKYLLILWLCFYSSIVAAHKASDSYLSLTVQDNALVEGRWDIALRDLDVLLNLDENQDRQLTWGEVLEKNQVKRIYPLNQDFDHNFHEAIANIESEAKEGSVVQVIQAGYSIADRLIRPALVGVAKAKNSEN